MIKLPQMTGYTKKIDKNVTMFLELIINNF